LPTPVNLEEDLIPDKKAALADTSHAVLGFLTNRNCDIVKRFSFKKMQECQ
jgi:hypothetical protein